ncbi:MAG: aconitate hydratase AcnA [Spirochaetaceae bacterium]|nr:MAG: aconitate hydratase AcnA [Spirochaetaceae bacterium]
MTIPAGSDSFNVKSTVKTPSGDFAYFSLDKLADSGFPNVKTLPFSVKVLLESVLRCENGREIVKDHVREMAEYDPKNPGKTEIPFTPARVLLQDFTGVPCVVDLAAMRNAMARLGGRPSRINPRLPVDLVIDHSVQVDFFAASDALRKNAELEFTRNRERYEFLRWGQAAFENFRVVPPASGICHQVNLEYLGQVVQSGESAGDRIAYFDSVVGTDSHTPMINGLGVLGWGVGGIEAEAAMLGQPIFMLAPPVVGVKVVGRLNAGITATDLVLTITQMLRAHGVVGKFVEFFGAGLSGMTVPDRATISNMAPEYGATVGYFPIDDKTLEYLWATGRPKSVIELTEAYAHAQRVFRTAATADPVFDQVIEFDLGSVEPSIAGPKRPQDRIAVKNVKAEWAKALTQTIENRGYNLSTTELAKSARVSLPNGDEAELTHGDVVIAAITSCTNTSNPSVLLGAGLVAKKAIEAGLKPKPWVKTSFAPGSMVVTEYLIRAGLMEYLEKVGFHLVGYGCTTCIGNSGPLPQPIADGVVEADLVVAGVLSGNRNFEGRINPHTRANFLMSPPLVVAYALAGKVGIDLADDPIGHGENGNPVYLRDIWPDEAELAEYVKKALDRDAFIKSYDGLEESNPEWNKIGLSGGEIYDWKDHSTYVQEPPFFTDTTLEVLPIGPIVGARVLVLAGDSITTDHISPAGAISPDSPAGEYLLANGVPLAEFNSYGSRRGNDRVMTRGTFANIRFRNLLVPGTEGSRTVYHPSGEILDIFMASLKYKESETPLVVIAGKDYGMGSSRDWAAKGAYLLGIRVVIAESYERIHRSNLVGMGILPLEFKPGENAASLGLTGSELYSVAIDDTLEPGVEVDVLVTGDDGTERTIQTLCRIDSPVEVEYYRNGGILQTVLRKFIAEA